MERELTALEHRLYKFLAEKDAEIARLEATPKEIMKEVFDKVLIYPHDMVRLEDAYKLAVALRRSNRKLCLAKAQEWRNYASFCGMQSSCHNHRGFGKTAEKWSWKQCHAWRCMKHWIALANEPTWAKFLQLIHKETK